MAVKARADDEASSSSFDVSPKAGQPTTLRTLSIPDADPPELHLLARRDVGAAAAELVGQARDGAELRRARDAVGNAQAHHEVAGRLLPEEHAPPLQPLEIPFLDRLDAEPRVASDVRADVESVLPALQLLHLVDALLEGEGQKKTPSAQDGVVAGARGLFAELGGRAACGRQRPYPGAGRRKRPERRGVALAGARRGVLARRTIGQRPGSGAETVGGAGSGGRS
jgi:hypothetical protein